MQLLDRSIFQEVIWDTAKYHWGVSISGNTAGSISGNPPHPFNSWFPATSVTIPTFSLNVASDFGVGDGSTRGIPVGTNISNKLKITFIDSYPAVLYSWLEKWITKDCKRNGLPRPIKGRGVLKNINVVRFKNDGSVFRQWTFEAHPVGNFSFSPDDGAEVSTFSVEFNIWRATVSELY